ncbi:amino acid adenylation domain-containing protein [Paenibacillus zeirhizosphaerae]
MERRLAGIFADVLEMNTIGRDCNFFDWGGHSLKAMQLVSRVQQEFNLEMRLKDLFRYPVLQELALRLEEREERAVEEQEPLPVVQFQWPQPAVHKEDYPLSSAQQRLFILEQFQDIGTSYNMPFVLRLEGELDIERVKFVYTTMLSRHAALRTSFHLTEDRGPVQRVAPLESIQAEIRLYPCELEDRQAVQDLIQQFIQPFVLDQASLVRVGIVQMQERRHLLMVDMHHLISDGVSMDVWVDEFIRLYTNDNELEPSRLQYPDYAVWQQQQLHSGIFERHKAFWQNQLAGPLPVLQMPADYTRPAVRNYAGSQYSFTLGQELTEKLRSCCREHGVTLYMLTLAAYGALLHQYTGQDDLVIGTPVAGRSHADLFRVIGMFSNTLAIRCHPEPGKTAAVFLQEVKNIALHAFEHADYPFEELVQALNVPRDTSRNPVFDTMFSLQNTPSRTLQIPGLSCEPYAFETKQSAFDLSLQIHEQKDRLELFIEYSTSLFREATIHRLMRHYCNILQIFATRPGALLSEVDMLTNEEKHLILQQFNSPGVGREQSAITVPYLVERQAVTAPNRLAVHNGEDRLTYRELMQKVDMLARHLTELEMVEGKTVAILMSNSSAMIVGLLAIQRMGAICLPIDPEYPEKRIAFMLKDADAFLLITDVQTRVPLSWTGQTLRMSGTEVVGISLSKADLCGDVSDSLFGAPGEARAWLPDRSQPEAIAYVLYTSGTTGQPKGVKISHQNLAHYVTRFNEMFHLDADDRVLHHSSTSFDTSIEEIYPALVAGGSVHIAAKDKARHVESLAALIEERSVTVISGSPVMLSELDRHLQHHRVRLFISGGDVLKKQHVSRLMQNAEVFNSYGPTETTVCAAYHRCQDSDGDMMPIGKPIPGYRIYILNRSGQLQPPGIPGELCIAGSGVAQGYLGREDLTAERFTPDPYGTGSMYRTGDLAKWDEQGNLHFLGRVDQQVKIRGYRVELQEIETALLQIPGVQEAVVLATADQDHFQRLQAFLVSDIPQHPGQTRERLLLELPEYMIPSQFIMLDRMPLTHNGKVDRRKLEQEHDHLQEVAQESRAAEPANPVESRLLHIWKEVLNVDELGVHDNFFASGGHSLRATSLAVKIRHEFRLDFNLQHVFQYQTIAETAVFLKSSLAEAHLDDILPAKQADHYPVSSAQKRMLLLNAAEEAGISYNMPMVLEVAGKLDENRCRAALAELIGRHEILRTSFHFIDGMPVQKVHNQGEAEWIEIEAAQNEVEAKIKEQIRPFRLDQPTHLRVCLIHTDEQSAVLVFDIHHIISDGVSLSILIAEFMDLYMRKELPALHVQYKDFAVWQNRMLSSPLMQQQKNYWLGQFEDEVPALELPYDYERPKLQSFSGSSISFEVGQELSEQLKQLALRTDTTLYMLLLAAYYALLYRYSGQRDIVVGCPIAGRQHERLEHMLGMFVNTLPLRMQIDGDCKFEDLLQTVRQRTLDGYAHQDYPFDDLVEQLDYRRDLSRNPLFDTVLVMQNMESPPSMIPDVQFQARDYERNSTMFDIRFEVTEGIRDLQFTMDYCTGLFKASTIRHMTRNYMQILQQIVRNTAMELDRMELEHGYTIRERQDWLESISFDF